FKEFVMTDTRSRTVFSLVAVLVLLFTFGLGALSSYVLIPAGRAGTALDANNPPTTTTQGTPARPGPSTSPQDLTAQMQEFYEIVDLLNKESYYRPLDNQKLVYGAIQGMMHAVGDDYTRFETPQQAAVT